MIYDIQLLRQGCLFTQRKQSYPTARDNGIEWPDTSMPPLRPRLQNKCFRRYSHGHTTLVTSRITLPLPSKRADLT